VYRPGIELHILHDGDLLADVFEVPLDQIRRYEDYFRTLVQIAGASPFIHCHNFTELQLSCGFKPDGISESLRRLAEEWWTSNQGTPIWCERFRKTLGMMNLREYPWQTAANLLHQARVGSLGKGFENLERKVHRTMVEYHVRDRIIHRLDPRPICFPDAIHATTQQRPGRLAVWLVRRGRGLLPWHGIGVVDRQDQVSVRPAEHVIGLQGCRPVYVESEESPFLYDESGKTYGEGPAA
jgi:hypothetical protein